jgi:hypothetical protein
MGDHKESAETNHERDVAAYISLVIAVPFQALIVIVTVASTLPVWQQVAINVLSVSNYWPFVWLGRRGVWVRGRRALIAVVLYLATLLLCSGVLIRGSRGGS